MAMMAVNRKSWILYFQQFPSNIDKVLLLLAMQTVFRVKYFLFLFLFCRLLSPAAPLVADIKYFLSLKDFRLTFIMKQWTLVRFLLPVSSCANQVFVLGCLVKYRCLHDWMLISLNCEFYWLPTPLYGENLFKANYLGFTRAANF